jgi:hypothetical protein
VWRQQQQQPPAPADAASTSASAAGPETPTLHLHDPSAPLPAPPAYMNAAYYLFQPARAQHPDAQRAGGASPRPRSTAKSRKTKGSRRSAAPEDADDDGVPAFRREFEKFHGENGVRTVLGSIGPVANGRRRVLTRSTLTLT